MSLLTEATRNVSADEPPARWHANGADMLSSYAGLQEYSASATALVAETQVPAGKAWNRETSLPAT